MEGDVGPPWHGEEIPLRVGAAHHDPAGQSPTGFHGRLGHSGCKYHAAAATTVTSLKRAKRLDEVDEMPTTLTDTQSRRVDVCGRSAFITPLHSRRDPRESSAPSCRYQGPGLIEDPPERSNLGHDVIGVSPSIQSLNLFCSSLPSV